MTKGLKIWLYTCIVGVILGAGLLFSTAAQAANGDTPNPDTTTSSTQKANGDTVTTKTEPPTQPQEWYAPGGILMGSIGGIFLIVREIKGVRQMDVQGYRDRAEAAENKVNTETSKLATQIQRLEQKLDTALEDVETKHDEWLAEVAHRRKLEILLAENGILVPQVLPPVTG